jgi:hypothetical protein
LLPWFIRRESRIVVVDYYRSATPIGMVPMLQAMFADRGDAGPIMRALAKNLCYGLITKVSVAAMQPKVLRLCPCDGSWSALSHGLTVAVDRSKLGII